MLIVSNPLVLHHEKLGAKLDQANSPLSFTDPVDEYWTIRHAAGIADVSNTGRLIITGKDRVAFLNGLLTNDIAKVKEGEGQHSALLSPKARVLADLYLYQQENQVLVDTCDSSASKIKESLDRFVITEDVQIKNVSTDLVQLTIQGPKSSEMIKESLKTEVADLKPLQHKPVGPGSIVCRDRTGLGGYDIFLPSEEAEAVWQGFLLCGGEQGLAPVGATAMEILRVEAGFPRYGVDVDDNTIVLEAGFKDAISFTKGCYMGQEVVARATHIGRVNKQLVGLEIEATVPPSPRTKLKSGGSEAGFVTSAAFSPGKKKVAGLGYANRDFAKDGTVLTVEDGDKPLSAKVTRVL
ncbi:aminomethyltransferase family protein [Candidatus Bathyarchaeota archaeon]|nr:aminomethyltransferase family protein [Candidatus Bathyarchaeota archaeon]